VLWFECGIKRVKTLIENIAAITLTGATHYRTFC
jgi:hypothetical protein